MKNFEEQTYDDLTDDEYEKIFSGNAKRLLRMTPNP